MSVNLMVNFTEFLQCQTIGIHHEFYCSLLNFLLKCIAVFSFAKHEEIFFTSKHQTCAKVSVMMCLR